MISCRGRNGWFNYHRHTVLNGSGRGVPSNESFVDIFSKREGDTAPILFHGDRDELRAVFLEILTRLGDSSPQVTKSSNNEEREAKIRRIADDRSENLDLRDYIRSYFADQVEELSKLSDSELDKVFDEEVGE